MSWSVAHPYRFNTVSHAVAIALLCTCGTAASLTANAATLGHIQIHSAQNEPLSASIDVSDIEVAHFAAYLASDGLYKELGLTPNPTISARFVADSVHHGRIMLSSTQPIAMPFADVVLTLNNNGDRDIIPKTLLMPLDRPAVMHTPLMVQNSAPPPLSTAPVARHAPVSVPLMAQQVKAVKPLTVIATDVMPPLPSAAHDSLSDAPMLAQQTQMQTPLLVTKTAAMPPMPSTQPSAAMGSTLTEAPLLAQQHSTHGTQTNTSNITVQQPIPLDSALDAVLTAKASAAQPTAPSAQLVHQPLQPKVLTALPALPNSQSDVLSAPLLAKQTIKQTKNAEVKTVKLAANKGSKADSNELKAAATPVTTSTKIQTTRRIAQKSVSHKTTTPELSAAISTTESAVHIETTRRITRVNLPERPAFLETRDNSIAQDSSHDMLDDAMLSDLADISRTVARSQTSKTVQDSAFHHRAAPLIKNQKAIELEAHLQELSN